VCTAAPAHHEPLRSVFVASDVDLALSAGLGAGGELLDESFIMTARGS
jgi:hypothetical protein